MKEWIFVRFTYNSESGMIEVVERIESDDLPTLLQYGEYMNEQEGTHYNVRHRSQKEVMP